MQAHLYADKPLDIDGLQGFMVELGKLDLDVEITELDVIDWKLPADSATRDRAAASLVGSFLDAISSVRRPKAIVTWGLSDRYSWVHETFPRKDKARARPLPLDADFKPKPMMAVLDRYRRSQS
jgi:endo-1,4-beta-xylanase